VRLPAWAYPANAMVHRPAGESSQWASSAALARRPACCQAPDLRRYRGMRSVRRPRRGIL